MGDSFLIEIRIEKCLFYPLSSIAKLDIYAPSKYYFWDFPYKPPCGTYRE
jgi:hypothetical protein